MARCIKIGIVALFAALAACSDSGPNVTRATLDGTGMTPLSISVQANTGVEFLNADDVSHQLFSYDCAEVSTAIIEAGDAVTVFPGPGPKTCHVEDLLSPNATQFRGTIDVQAAFRQPSDGA